MHVPFITSAESSGRVYRRKGGGGKGGGRSSSGGSKSSSSSGFKTNSSKSKSKPISFSSGGKSKTSRSYGGGGGVPVVIPAGQMFAGRIAGGGTRSQIFGTRTYGSGYPGVSGRGVSGRGFPFYFWPLAWGGVGGLGTATYLHNDEYGLPNNMSRPGGAMAAAAFPSASTNTIFRVMADNATIIDLITDLKANCSSSLGPSTSTTPSAYGGTPAPEQVVQYYRASSIALTLDGYNNTATFAAEGTPDTPLPNGIDMRLLDCLNQTIGLAAPLADGARVRWDSPHMGLLGLVWVLWNLISLF